MVGKPPAGSKRAASVGGVASYALPAALLHGDVFGCPDRVVTLIETHISWVFLCGAFAYKVKKPVALGFLDFSTLARRRACCEAELRLNRRLAPGLYLGLVALRATPAGPRVGPLDADADGTVLDYAVRMRRFPQSALLTHTPLDAALIDRLAARLAAFHADAARAAPDGPYGTPAAVLAPMRENFRQIVAQVANQSASQSGRLALTAADRRRLDRLARWTAAAHARLTPRLARRLADGRVRECHGDLHRGNIVLLDGEPVPFDGIEFNPALRWIDCISELAFLVMDLHAAGAPAAALRLVNRYLEATGDFDGLPLLRLYLVYRALVRAKVAAIRAAQAPSAETAPTVHQTGAAPVPGEPAAHTFRRYLALARRLACRPARRVIITHGPSGSGKTHLGRTLAARLGLVHLRADVERKRRFGLAATDRPDAALAAVLYGAAATADTYAGLLALAAQILDAGFGVLVDATFLTRAQRAPFAGLAAARGLDFRILACDAPDAVLAARLVARAAADRDASDATPAQVAAQRERCEALTDAERAAAIVVDNAASVVLPALAARFG